MQHFNTIPHLICDLKGVELEVVAYVRNERYGRPYCPAHFYVNKRDMLKIIMHKVCTLYKCTYTCTAI